MKPQEAMNWCEQFTDNLVMVDVDTKRRTLGLQAMQVCKSALEKQIPKKPSETDKARCIHCACVVRRDERFCKNCGQALDWCNAE